MRALVSRYGHGNPINALQRILREWFFQQHDPLQRADPVRSIQKAQQPVRRIVAPVCVQIVRRVAAGSILRRIARQDCMDLCKACDIPLQHFIRVVSPIRIAADLDFKQRTAFIGQRLDLFLACRIGYKRDIAEFPLARDEKIRDRAYQFAERTALLTVPELPQRPVYRRERVEHERCPQLCVACNALCVGKCIVQDSPEHMLRLDKRFALQSPERVLRGFKHQRIAAFGSERMEDRAVRPEYALHAISACAKRAVCLHCRGDLPQLVQMSTLEAQRVNRLPAVLQGRFRDLHGSLTRYG